MPPFTIVSDFKPTGDQPQTSIVAPGNLRCGGTRMTYKFTAVITREGKFFVSDCPELGITSQGLSLDEALDNLKEAIHLYLKDEEAALL